MNLADINVLVGAFRRDTAHHDTCRDWLSHTIEDVMPFAVSPLALAAVVRITTNPRIFKAPSTVVEAFAFCDNLLNQPHARVVEPGERHWEIFKQLCAATGIQGARTSDAWYAALSIESRCEWVTLDSDYARFRGLKLRRL